MQLFTFTNSENIEIQGYCSLPAGKPIAVIQLVHGMQEHAGRYAHFADWLNSKGIAVYANDHIGHGLTAKNPEDLAHFPRKDDWRRSVEILHTLSQKIKAAHPGIPLFLLGHSMGSVMTQSFMIRYGEKADGYILSGAIRQPFLMAASGKLLAAALSVLFGPGDRSRLLVSLGYGQYKKYFRPNRTGADWLCSVNSVVDEYIASPLCGKRLSNRFYYNFTRGFLFILKRKNLRKIPAGLPVLIIAGKDDPAGFFGKAPLKINKMLSKHALSKVDMKLYAGCRHEVLNEINREEVYLDVFEWVRNNSSYFRSENT